MPFIQRQVNPNYLSKTSLWLENGKPKINDNELEAVTNNTLSNVLRQLSSLLTIADDIFKELGYQLCEINKKSEALKIKINKVDKKIMEFDPKKVSVPESDICTFAQRKIHYRKKQEITTNLISVETRPSSLKVLYESASRTPISIMRQLDRWRKDGHRSSKFFMCTPVLGQKRKRIKCNGDIEIETRVPASFEELRRWTSREALGDITVTPDCPNKIPYGDCDETDYNLSDEEGIDYKLPSPEEQVHVIALKFPSELVSVDISGRAFERMSSKRRSHIGIGSLRDNESGKPGNKARRSRSKRRNTLAGTDQKEIENAVSAGESQPSSTSVQEIKPQVKTVGRSKSSDMLRSNSKKESPEIKKSHFTTLRQWSKNRYDKLMNRSNEDKKDKDIDEFNLYETVTMKRRRNIDKKTSHQRSSSISSSEKSSINSTFSNVLNIAVKLRESSSQKKERRVGRNKEEQPNSSSGNWSASSESGRNSIGSEITNSTIQPKSTTSATTSNNSLNFPPSSSICSRRKFVNASASSSVTSEGTLTPDIIQDIHEDGETSSVYSCDTEGYYTSFHLDSGLKPLKEEELPATPLHSTNTLDNPSNSAENEYELFGKGSTSTTTSSAGTICTTLRASESNRSLIIGPTVPERKSSLTKYPDNDNDKTGTVKRSPSIIKSLKPSSDGAISPDSGHNTSSSPFESSPNGIRSCSEFEYSESSDMEGAERIRVKTIINSSRIPSMCVITPSQSDDENSQSSNNSNKKLIIQGTDKFINVNQLTGYATLESLNSDINQNSTSININGNRAPSPSGGTVIIKEDIPIIKQTQPIFKGTLLPLNNMLDKIKTNITNLKNRKEDKSPNRNNEDLGEYVTIADVRNNNNNNNINNNKTRENDINKNFKTDKTEYISLNELPCQINKNDSLERKKRQGARVTLDAEGKVVYSSDSLKRKKPPTTFEPGPFVKDNTKLCSSPNIIRNQKLIRPVNQIDRGVITNKTGKVIIKASDNNNPEIVRIPPTKIIDNTRTRSLSPKIKGKGAYVHIQDEVDGQTHKKDRVLLSPGRKMYQSVPELEKKLEIPKYQEMLYDRDPNQFYQNQYYLGRDTVYQTLPTRKTQYLQDFQPERSVTPDITRGLDKNKSIHQIYEPNLKYYNRKENYSTNYSIEDENLGIPLSMENLQNYPYSRQTEENLTPILKNYDEVDSFKVSPINPPRKSTGFKSSTPSQSQSSLNSTFLAKKSTMTNEELYAVIHKSKKKLNITTDDLNITSPITKNIETTIEKVKSLESGYLDNKIRTRSSWSPSSTQKDEINTSPIHKSKIQQISRLDFKKLLLQKSSNTLSNTKKTSAVEQLELSKQVQKRLFSPSIQQQQQPTMNILELSRSPTNLVNRKFSNPTSSPKNSTDKLKQTKLLSPRSQWRFANPRSDVLSSTILEDCREDEINISKDKKILPKRSEINLSEKFNLQKESTNFANVIPISQRIRARRADFFNTSNSPSKNSEVQSENIKMPTLETSF